MSKPLVRRQHPLYFIILLVATIKPLIIPILVFFVFGSKRNPFEWQPVVYYGAGAAAILYFAAMVLSWRRFTYIRDEHQLAVRSGILFRESKVIHRNRIHSVQIQQPLIQRLFGIAQVVVETAGSGSKPEAVLRAVSLEEAKEIQELARKNVGAIEPAQDEETPVVPAEPSAEFAERVDVSPGTFLLAALTTANLRLALAFIAGIGSFADDVLGESFYNSLADTALRYLTGPYAILIWASVALLLSWILSIGLYVWKYAGFNVEVRGDQATVSYGLLEKRRFVFPIGKVQAAMFVEGLLRRPFGRGELRVLVVHSDKEAAVMLHPFIKDTDVKNLLSRLIPHIEPISPDIQPPVGALLAFVRWKIAIAALAGGGAIAGFGIAAVWPSLLLIPVVTWWGYMQFKSEAAGMEGSHLVLRHRNIALTTAWMRRNHIQTLKLTASIPQRRKRWRTVNAAVMGGLRGYFFSARLLPAEKAEQIREWYGRRTR